MILSWVQIASILVREEIFYLKLWSYHCGVLAYHDSVVVVAIGYAPFNKNYDDNVVVIIKNLPNPHMFSLLKAFKGISLPSDWIRLFCHSIIIMLNRIDEISQYSSTTSSSKG